ncbi:hypothetical protein [Methylobacterium longum]|uniref:Uncharacterized protein n=1 Tax=Methylobacterium longum TaxID=767694 RepID=A0ABT8AN76_9HYPH|nr:hypothetical protein [Methylobacterium longum]MDN3571292.1 hypothetical protein [Methylobacterium longum]
MKRRNRSIDDSILSDPVVTQDIIDDAEIYLLGRDGCNAFDRANSSEKIGIIADSIVKSHSSSMRQRYESIATAYSVYAMFKENRIISESMIEAAHKLKINVKNYYTPLRLIVELHINYGESETKEDVRRAGKLYSRDVTVIKNLIKRNIKPSEVVALSAKPGEGLHAWQRYKPDSEAEQASDPVRGSAEQASELVDIASEPIGELAAGWAAMMRAAMAKRDGRDVPLDNQAERTDDSSRVEPTGHHRDLLTWEGIDENGQKVQIFQQVNRLPQEFVKLIFGLATSFAAPR